MANHRAVDAGQTALRHIVPVRMIGLSQEQVVDIYCIHRSRDLIDGLLPFGFRELELFFRRGKCGQSLEQFPGRSSFAIARLPG